MDAIDNYQVGDLLGRGGFASVYKARCINNGVDVAIKMVDKQQMIRAKMDERVRQEVGIHARLNHPSIVKLISYFEDNTYVYLVLELCHNGELARYIRNTKLAFSEQEARVIFEQVVSGVKYLHSHAIMHRDLTLANLMITSDMKVKIGDFGLATKIQSPSERHVTMCGTPNFISPEVATRSSHGLEADVWGLGCLLYTLLVGKPPFDTAGVRSTLTRVVMGDYTLPDNLVLSPEVKDLIHQMLLKSPEQRIKLNSIVDHPWMRMDTSPVPQDSGMYTMSSTTNFSANSMSKPGPRPLAAFPVLTEYSEENETSAYSRAPPPGHQMGQRPMFPASHSTPVLSRPPTPSADAAPSLASLRYKLTSQPSVPSLQRETSLVSMASGPAGLSRQVSTPCLQPQEADMRSLRSNMSDPAFSHGPSHTPTPGHFSHQNSLHSHQPHSTPGYHPSSLSQHSQPQPLVRPRPPSPVTSSLPPRLSTTRLRPTRQRNKNVMANISVNGEVCLEIIKNKRGQEQVTEVIRISGDGERIVIYTPEPGTCLGNTPPPTPCSGADALHSYLSLPAKYHKKYTHAARFVALVKACTPKITLYTSQAKCYLMENNEADFEAYFYEGAKVTLSKGSMTIKEKEGYSQVSHDNNDIDQFATMIYYFQTLDYPISDSNCPASLSLVTGQYYCVLSHSQSYFSPYCRSRESGSPALPECDQPALPALSLLAAHLPPGAGQEARPGHHPRPGKQQPREGKQAAREPRCWDDRVPH